MAWDPTFDWADTSSFNGEARKLSILTEMITQLNAKATLQGKVTLQTPLAGIVFDLSSFNLKFEELVPLFRDSILGDGSYWTITKLESAIGANMPTPSYMITPTWINWMYQAISLLLFYTYGDSWNGTESNSGSYLDTNFNYRWSTRGAGFRSISGGEYVSTTSVYGDRPTINSRWSTATLPFSYHTAKFNLWTDIPLSGGALIQAFVGSMVLIMRTVAAGISILVGAPDPSGNGDNTFYQLPYYMTATPFSLNLEFESINGVHSCYVNGSLAHQFAYSSYIPNQTNFFQNVRTTAVDFTIKIGAFQILGAGGRQLYFEQ